MTSKVMSILLTIVQVYLVCVPHLQSVKYELNWVISKVNFYFAEGRLNEAAKFT